MLKENTFDSKGLRPSAEFAWILGVLCGGGAVKQGAISISGYEIDFLAIFSQRFEQLFQLKPRRYTQLDKKADKNRTSYAFNNRALVAELGDLRTASWGETIPHRHAWIAEDATYAQAFLGGYFDRNGTLTNPLVDDDYRAVLHLSSWTGYHTLESLLENVGVSGVAPKKSARVATNLRGVQIDGLMRMHRFANVVTSLQPRKETLLDLYRELPPRVFNVDPRILAAYEQAMDLHTNDHWGSQRLSTHFYLQGLRISVSQIDGWLYGGRNPHNWQSRYEYQFSIPTPEALAHFPNQEIITTFLQRFKKDLGTPPVCATIYAAMINLTEAESHLDTLIAKQRKLNQQVTDQKTIVAAKKLVVHELEKIKNAETIPELDTLLERFEVVYMQAVRKILGSNPKSV